MPRQHTSEPANASQPTARPQHHPQERPQRLTAIDLALISVFAALIIALGFFTIPVGAFGIPIVLQNSAVLLTAMLLGSLRGGLATTLFLAVGLVGIPNLAGGHTTLAALAGVSIGYLVGYILSAFLVGYLAQKASWSTIQRAITLAAAGLIGLAIQYACGSLGLILRANMTATEALLSNTPFLAADLIELAVTVTIALSVTRIVPDLLPVTTVSASTNR